MSDSQCHHIQPGQKYSDWSGPQPRYCSWEPLWSGDQQSVWLSSSGKRWYWPSSTEFPDGGHKKPAQKSPWRMLFPPRIPICEYFPLAENFSREFFLKTPWDPLGILLEGFQMVGKKKPAQKRPQRMLFPHRVSICKYFPLAENFSRELFF